MGAGNAVFDATHAREVQGPWNVATKAADMVDYEKQPFSRHGLRIQSSYIDCMRHALHPAK